MLEAIIQTDIWVVILTLCLLPYILIEVTAFTLILVKSFALKVSGKSKPTHDQDAKLPTLSVVMPAYNEEKGVIAAVESVLANDYEHFEVVLVNDGSTDQTLAILQSHFQLEPIDRLQTVQLSSSPVHEVYRSAMKPHLWVIDKSHSGKGKADALNVGLSYASGEIACVMDADSFLDHNSLQELVQPFLERPETIAAGGAIRGITSNIQLGPFKIPNLLTWGQKIEYARIFFMDRVVLSSFNINYIISGAFGAFRLDLLRKLGGYRCASLAEDMDLTLRLHRHCLENDMDYHIAHVSRANCWTEVPHNLKILRRQRARWQAGFLETVKNNTDMLASPHFKKLGRFILPYCLISAFEPLFWVSSLVLTIKGLMEPSYSDSVLMTFLLCHLIFSSTYFLASMLAQPNFSLKALAQSFGTYIGWLIFGRIYDLSSFCLRLTGYWKYWRQENSWGHMARKGFSTEQVNAAITVTKEPIYLTTSTDRHHEAMKSLKANTEPRIKAASQSH